MYSIQGELTDTERRLWMRAIVTAAQSYQALEDVPQPSSSEQTEAAGKQTKALSPETFIFGQPLDRITGAVSTSPHRISQGREGSYYYTTIRFF